MVLLGLDARPARTRVLCPLALEYSARLHAGGQECALPHLSQGGSRSPPSTSAAVIGLRNVPQQSISG
eukprot:1158858-Pelagomonas_calceolata.AAC.7